MKWSPVKSGIAFVFLWCTISGGWYLSRTAALNEAVLMNNLPVATQMLQQGADPNIPWFDGPPLLKTADMKMVKLLLDHKANPNINDKMGRSLLLNAVQIDDRESVRLFVHAGANVNVRASSGLSPLEEARYRNLDAIEGVLISAGAK